MKLSEYLKEKPETAMAFAARMKVSRSFVSRLLSGDRAPSVALMYRVERATAGKVSLYDWPRAPPQKPS